MTHNVSLPRHRYVWVVPGSVLQDRVVLANHPLLPAVWFGVSVQPGRVMGCHILLESGAMVVDVPLHALRSRPDADAADWTVQDAYRWDGFGWVGEVFEPVYLSGLTARLLDAAHAPTMHVGSLWFCLDHLNDGFSLEPAQHKHLWVVALTNGAFVQVPQDQLLVTESSFTVAHGVPAIQRQTQRWEVEP